MLQDRSSQTSHSAWHQHDSLHDFYIMQVDPVNADTEHALATGEIPRKS